MKVLTFMTIFLLSMSSFSLESCLEYPSFGEKEAPYHGVITEVSEELSFGSCPRSALVRGTFVAYLSQVVDYKGEQRCVYQMQNLAFMCRK